MTLLPIRPVAPMMRMRGFFWSWDDMVALSLPFEPVFIDAEWPFVKIPAVWGHGQATELRKGKRRKRGCGNSPAAISSVVAKRILLNHSNRGRPSQALAKTLMCCLRAACRNLRQLSRACCGIGPNPPARVSLVQTAFCLAGVRGLEPANVSLKKRLEYLANSHWIYGIAGTRD
jgi:hypothetical protein